MLQSDTTLTEGPRGVPDARSRTQILIVAEDRLMQRVLRRTFRDEDYTVTICGEARAGLGAFRAEHPAAVILDLIMPNITCRELCKMMKAEQPETPVIVVSGISEVADKVPLLEIGADDYVTKPFSPRELIARVKRALKGHGVQ